MNRKLARTIAVPAIAGAALIGTSVAAFASNGQTDHLTGKNAATYTDPLVGPVSCNETQHPKFDTVACQSTTGAPLTNVSPGQVVTSPWYSDFNGALGTITFTVSADGLSYSGKATY